MNFPTTKEFLDDIVKNELDMKNNIIKDMKNYSEKVKHLQNILKKEIDEPTFDNPLSKHDYYKECYQTLKKIKNENREDYEKLKQIEIKLCKTLKENERDLPNGKNFSRLIRIRIFSINL